MRISKTIDPRTAEEKQNDFLKYLEEYGNITRAAKKAKISRATPYNWIDNDPAFKERFKKSAQIGIDALEDEAKRRAFEGVKKPVYQNGKLVGKVVEYSDSLLMFLLKGNKPDQYKERFQHGGDPENPINHNVTTRVIFEDMTEEKS